MEQNQTIIGTEIAILPPADRAAIALNSSGIEKQLIDMVQESANIVSVIDKAGRDEAHSAAMALRGVRTTIAKTGKAAREDAQAFSKAVIAEEARLIAIIAPEEDRVIRLRDGYDAKIAAEKAERERKEAERKAALQAKVDAIRNIALSMDGATSKEVAEEIVSLQEFVPGEEFMEYSEAAKEAAKYAISALTALGVRQAAKEAEAAELERQRSENARIAAEQEAERKRLAAIAVEQAAAMKVEQERISAEHKAAADALAAERAALQAERDALSAEKLAAEQEKLAAERAKEAEQKEQAPEHVEPLEKTVIGIPPSIDKELTALATQHKGEIIIKNPEPLLQFYYDAAADVLTVEGIKYAGGMFRQLGGALPEGKPFVIRSRADGVLTVSDFTGEA